MSKDAREQAQLEDVDEAVYNLYEGFKSLTEYEKGEYDGLSGFPPLMDKSQDYYDGYNKGYAYAQQRSAEYDR